MNSFQALANVRPDSPTVPAILYLDAFAKRLYHMKYIRSTLQSMGIVGIKPITDISAITIMAIYVFLPTIENIEIIKRVLSQPGSNMISLYSLTSMTNYDIAQFAQCDKQNRINKLIELYFNFVPQINHINVGNHTAIYSMLLANRCQPRAIINDLNIVDPEMQTLSRDIVQHITATDDFRFPRGNHPNIIIYDAQHNDPISPHMICWTYGALLIDMLHMRDNVVIIDDPDIPDKYKSIRIDFADEFYNDNKYNNWGTLATNYDAYRQHMISRAKQYNATYSGDLDIAGMQMFIAEYPQFKSEYDRYICHTIMIATMNKIINANRLLELSEISNILLSSSLFISFDTDKYDEMHAILADPTLSDYWRSRYQSIYEHLRDKRNNAIGLRYKFRLPRSDNIHMVYRSRLYFMLLRIINNDYAQYQTTQLDMPIDMTHDDIHYIIYTNDISPVDILMIRQYKQYYNIHIELIKFE